MDFSPRCGFYCIGAFLFLFIAKKIVEAHGGRIWVESEGEEKGSSFNFAIPVGDNGDGADVHTQASLPHGENEAARQEQPGPSVPSATQQEQPVAQVPPSVPSAPKQEPAANVPQILPSAPL